MADIFDELNQMTEDELRLQLALFENVTITNVVKETGYRMVGGIRDLANALSEAFGSKNQFVYDVRTVTDIVRDFQLELGMKSKEELRLQIEERVIQIVKDLSGERIDSALQKERINKIIVDEAAKAFSIEKYKTIGNKMDDIIIEYNNAFLNTMHNQLVKETAQQKAVTDRRIQDRMNAVSIETKRQLQEAVMPKEFNGVGIGKVIRSERGCRNLENVLMILGKEALNCEAAEVWTIYMAMKELKRPVRMQLARLIWFVGHKNGKKYAVSQDILPSYISADLKIEAMQKEKEFTMLMQQRNAIEEKLRKNNEYLDKQLSMEEKIRERMGEGELHYGELLQKFSQLERKKEEYISGKRGEDESKKYYAQVNETKRNLDRVEQENQKLIKKINEQTERVLAAQKEKEKIEKEYETIEAVSQKQIEERKTKLQTEWKSYFYKFQFDTQIFDTIVTQYSLDERLNIESMLKELHDADNPENLYDDVKDLYCICYAYIAQGKAVIIEYSANSIQKITRK